jgi:hypothetical protein
MHTRLLLLLLLLRLRLSPPPILTLRKRCKCILCQCYCCCCCHLLLLLLLLLLLRKLPHTLLLQILLLPSSLLPLSTLRACRRGSRSICTRVIQREPVRRLRHALRARTRPGSTPRALDTAEFDRLSSLTKDLDSSTKQHLLKRCVPSTLTSKPTLHLFR